MTEIPSPIAGREPQSNEEWFLREAIATQCQRIFEEGQNGDLQLPHADMILRAVERAGWKLVRAETSDAEEVEALREMLRKVQKGVGWWAALSYVDGVNGQSRWTEQERALLHRAGL